MAIHAQLFVTVGQDELSPPPHLVSMWPTVAFVFTIQFPPGDCSAPVRRF